jgi:tRNA(adenine34) deaminase
MISSTHGHEYFMKEALKEAQYAFEKDEVPVGAVLVIQNKIIARSHNQVELLSDATAHAEILALTSGFSALNSKYLPEASLYVTLEPCLMCAGALRWSKIGKIIYGASDVKNGASAFCHKHPYHEKAIVTPNVMADECKHLMQSFFAKKR